MASTRHARSPALPASLTTPDGCVAGAEPAAHLGGPVGVLLLHGFTGSPWEIRPIADRLVEGGYSVATPLLAGHGTRLGALQQTTWRDWLASARDAIGWLESHVERVHLVGLSMGGLLAMLLSQQRNVRPTASLSLLAPAVALPRTTRLLLQAAHLLPWSFVLGKDDPGLPDGRHPPAYDGIPMRAAASFLELQELTLAGMRPTRLPALVMHGTRDLTVPFSAGREAIVTLLGSSIRFVPVDGGGHLLPRDHRGREVVDAVADHIASAEAALSDGRASTAR